MRMRIGWVVLVVAVACGQGGRERFGAEWRRAVAARDGGAAWELLDRDSRARITMGVERAQARAAGDPTWREVFAWVNRPVDVTLPAEEVAQRILGERLGRGIDLADDGSDRIHREEGHWVAAVDAVGFVAEDGTPLSITALWLRRPARAATVADAAPAPAAVPAAGRVIKVRWEGRTVDEIDAEYAAEGAKIAAALGLGGAYATDVTRIMEVFSFHGTGQRAGVSEFVLGADGSITPTVYVWSGAERRAVAERQPRLDFGAWPGHN